MHGTAYEYTTESHVSSEPPPIRANPEYVKTVPGIRKIAEIVLCILVLICASIDDWAFRGGGWVQFVASSAFLSTTIFFLFHLFNVIPRLPGPWVFIEFLYYCLYSLLYIIAAIVCSVRAHVADSIAAATFFTFLALLVYGIDTYFQYRNWQANQHHATTTTQAGGTTTTTTTTYETKTQY